MRSSGKVPRRPASKPQSPKDLAKDMAGRASFDRAKVRRDSQRAAQTAERLLQELDDLLKHLPQKR